MKSSLRLALAAIIASGTTALANDYEVEGYGDPGYAYGEIEAGWSGDVEGYIYLEDGREVYISGEFNGFGEVDVYDEDGNYYNLEVE